MKRRFDKARAYHRKVFVRYTHPSGFVVDRTIERRIGGVVYYREVAHDIGRAQERV